MFTANNIFFCILFLLSIFYTPQIVLCQSSSEPNSTAVISNAINEHLPEWLRIGGDYRLRWEGRSGLAGNKDREDSYLLSRIRLDLTFKFSNQWKIFIQGQDSKAFGFNTHPVPSIHEDSFDLRQAYISWKQNKKYGWAFQAGRQELNFGDQRLIGSLNWTNTARSFDAVKVSYTNKNYSIDTFASSIVNIDDEHFDKHRDGNNLYGIHATFPQIHPKVRLSTYLYWKTDPLVISEHKISKDADIFTLGITANGKFSESTLYEFDAMLQRGSFSLDSIKAQAFHTRFTHAFSTKRNDIPKILVEYNYASGDKNPTDGIHGTFDQLYPTGHAKYGVIDQVGLRNQHNFRLGTTWQLNPKLKIEIDYHSFWLAQTKDGLYNAGGALIARIPSGTNNSHIAQEVDLQVNYSPKSGIDISGGYAHRIPGAFWKLATPGSPESFGYLSINYRF